MISWVKLTIIELAIEARIFNVLRKILTPSRYYQQITYQYKQEKLE